MQDTDMESDNGSAPDILTGVFPWLFGAVVVLVLCGAVLVVVSVIRSRRVLRQAGINPSTAQAQFAVRMMNSRSLAPNPTVEQRLTELARLRDGGVITASEYDTRRTQIIAST